MAHEQRFVDLIDKGVLKLDSYGRIWRVKRKVRDRDVYRACHPHLIGMQCRSGYVNLRLSVDNKLRNAKAHRIVWLYYNRGRGLREGYHINHLDGNPNNNRIDNLEEVTPEENRRHAKDVLKSYLGSRNGNAKLTEDDVRAIRQLVWTCTQRELAAVFGVAVATINDIISGRLWKHVE